jgi:ATP-binding cassette, subfamily B, bacterial
VFQVGTLVAFIALVSQLYGPLNEVSRLPLEIVTVLVSFDRVFEILDLEPLITERATAFPLPHADGAPTVEVEGVWFRYPDADQVSLDSLESVALPAPERPSDAWVLQDLTFEVPAGRLTALVGLSGAGKTTITHLVPRLYDPVRGAVRIGGHDVRDLTLESLRSVVGVVPQDAHLFHDTIRANLLYARPSATEKELIEACQTARIWELISSLPDGLDTVAGDRGYRFSGGEKQRLVLARLLLKAPSVVVLDEATAHLDSESEAAIQRALATALAGRTSLVIAHRLSTVRAADQILVVDGGQIVERGTHDELLAAGGVYAGLYRTQFAPQAALRSPGGFPWGIHGGGDNSGLPGALVCWQRNKCARAVARSYAELWPSARECIRCGVTSRRNPRLSSHRLTNHPGRKPSRKHCGGRCSAGAFAPSAWTSGKRSRKPRAGPGYRRSTCPRSSAGARNRPVR